MGVHNYRESVDHDYYRHSLVRDNDRSHIDWDEVGWSSCAVVELTGETDPVVDDIRHDQFEVGANSEKHISHDQAQVKEEEERVESTERAKEEEEKMKRGR